MQLNKPKAASGGFTDSWRPDESGLFHIRVFAFVHEGENNLATHTRIHFQGGNGAPIDCLGQGCPMCAEAVKTGNKRLGASNRYPMAIVVEGGEGIIQRYDAPSSVYSAISGILDDKDSPPQDILGNEGVDFAIKYKKGAKNPSEVYTVHLRRKNSEVYEIDESTIPDLIEECAAGSAPAVEDGAASDDVNEDVVVFKDSRGKKHEGIWEGKMQGDKYCIVVNGSLRKVPADRIISGIDIEDEPEADTLGITVGARVTVDIEGEDYEGEVTAIDDDQVDVKFDDGDEGQYPSDEVTLLSAEPEPEAEPEPAEDEAPKVGDTVTVKDPDDDTDYEVEIKSIDGDTMTVENDDFAPWDVPVDSIQ